MYYQKKKTATLFFRCPFYCWMQRFSSAAVEMSVWKEHHRWKLGLFWYPFKRYLNFLRLKASSKRKPTCFKGTTPFLTAKTSRLGTLMRTAVMHADLSPNSRKSGPLTVVVDVPPWWLPCTCTIRMALLFSILPILSLSPKVQVCCSGNVCMEGAPQMKRWKFRIYEFPFKKYFYLVSKHY